jgi:excisionase family DNA binding protein
MRARLHAVEIDEIVGELMTLKELTQRLRVKRSWVYDRIHANSLPFKYAKIGGQLRFPKDGIEDYLRKVTK